MQTAGGGGENKGAKGRCLVRDTTGVQNAQVGGEGRVAIIPFSETKHDQSHSHYLRNSDNFLIAVVSPAHAHHTNLCV